MMEHVFRKSRTDGAWASRFTKCSKLFDIFKSFNFLSPHLENHNVRVDVFGKSWSYDTWTNNYSSVSFGLNVSFDIERAALRSVRVLFSVNTLDIPTTFSRGNLVNTIPFEHALADRAIEFDEFSSVEGLFASRIAHFTRETIVGIRWVLTPKPIWTDRWLWRSMSKPTFNPKLTLLYAIEG
jgi:hypothetical protein